MAGAPDATTPRRRTVSANRWRGTRRSRRDRWRRACPAAGSRGLVDPMEAMAERGQHLVSVGAGGDGEIIGRLHRADDIQPRARQDAGDIRYIEGGQVHGDTAYQWHGGAVKEGTALVGQRAMQPVGVADRRRGNTART